MLSRFIGQYIVVVNEQMTYREIGDLLVLGPGIFDTTFESMTSAPTMPSVTTEKWGGNNEMLKRTHARSHHRFDLDAAPS